MELLHLYVRQEARQVRLVLPYSLEQEYHAGAVEVSVVAGVHIDREYTIDITNDSCAAFYFTASG